MTHPQGHQPKGDPSKPVGNNPPTGISASTSVSPPPPLAIEILRGTKKSLSSQYGEVHQGHMIDPVDGKKLAYSIHTSGLGLEVRLEGYGTKAMEAGHSGPVFIDFYSGKVQVVVHSDINKEEATHAICLEQALETARKEDDEDQQS